MTVSPTLLNTLPFDAEKEHTLQFTYTGAQIFAHKIVIKDNSTNTVVYNKKTSAMNTLARIPPNTLTNGNTYNIQISVFDHEGKESPLSNPAILKCLKTPTFTFTNIHEGLIVRNSFLDVELSYSQENGELLNAYTVTLYAVNQTTVVYDSGIRYSSDNLIVRVPEMLDDTTYYIRATGETVNGMEMDTGLIEIVCDYLKPDIFLKFRADNIPEEGSVRLTSNFILIEGKSQPEELVYIDDEKVSLLNGEKVWFDDGFTADNFVCEIIAEQIPDFTKFITFNMKSAMAYITWNYGYFEGSEEKQYYAELTAYQYVGSEKLNYVQISTRIPPLSDGEQVHFWMRHINGAFNLIVTKLNGTNTLIEGGDSA